MRPGRTTRAVAYLLNKSKLYFVHFRAFPPRAPYDTECSARWRDFVRIEADRLIRTVSGTRPRVRSARKTDRFVTEGFAPSTPYKPFYTVLFSRFVISRSRCSFVFTVWRLRYRKVYLAHAGPWSVLVTRSEFDLNFTPYSRTFTVVRGMTA